MKTEQARMNLKSLNIVLLNRKLDKAEQRFRLQPSVMNRIQLELLIREYQNVFYAAEVAS